MLYNEIILEASDNKKYCLNDFNTKIVLFFYPKDNTPGCSIEAHDFSVLYDDFLKLGYQVIGVSRDSVKSHQNFCLKKDLKMLLLSDKEETLCNAFDVIKDKMMFGKQVRGIQRSTFVLDENKNIIKEYRKVSPKDHAKSILEDLSK